MPLPITTTVGKIDSFSFNKNVPFISPLPNFPIWEQRKLWSQSAEVTESLVQSSEVPCKKYCLTLLYKIIYKKVIKNKY